MSAPIVEVRGLAKEFRLVHNARGTLKEYFLHPFQRATTTTHKALDDISFAIEPGECFGVIGRNGSGKSTLLKLMAGIYPPTRGSVVVRGKLSPVMELGVGFIPELDARTNIRINATLLGLSPETIRAKEAEIIAFASLEEFADQKLKNFSTGMVGRLAYAIAIQVPFDILLLDEVFAVGDRDFQSKCVATIDRFRREGRTVVMVSHSPEVLTYFADRVLVLDSGRTTSLGKTGEALAAYTAGDAAATGSGQ